MAKKRGFNTVFYRNQLKKEPSTHINAKIRFGLLMHEQGWEVAYEVDMKRTTVKGDRSYTVDVLLTKPATKNSPVEQKVIVEFDGESHGKMNRHLKDEFRDQVFAEEGIPTIRFLVDELIYKWRPVDIGYQSRKYGLTCSKEDVGSFMLSDEFILRTFNERLGASRAVLMGLFP